MMARASPGLIVEIANSTGVVIISRTGVFSGSCPLSASLPRPSRSVKMPATRFSLSITATAPTRLSSMVRIASATLASGGTAAATESQSSKTVITTPSNALIGEIRDPPVRVRGNTRFAHYDLRTAGVKGGWSQNGRKLLPIWGQARRAVDPARPRGSACLLLEHLAVLHHELHVFERLYVTQRVAAHGNDVGVRSGRNHADLSLHIEHLGSARSGALDGVHGRHAELHHAQKFLRHGLGPGNPAHVGAEDDFHPRLHRLLERRDMHRDAFAVTLAHGRVGWSPVVVVRAESGTVPGTLLQHLRDGGVVQVEAVLDGVAATIEGAMQSNAAVGVAGNFLAPAVSFVHDRLQLLHCQRGLGDQFAILAYPRAMRHVDLDPVSSMTELFACRFARFDRAVDDLHAFGHLQFGSVVLQGISTGSGNSERGDKKARPGKVAALDCLLDAHVAVARTFGLHVTQRSETLLQRPPHRNRGPRSAQGQRVLQDICIIAALRRVFSLQEDVGVGVNKPGKSRGAGEIDA